MFVCRLIYVCLSFKKEMRSSILMDSQWRDWPTRRYSDVVLWHVSISDSALASQSVSSLHSLVIITSASSTAIQSASHSTSSHLLSLDRRLNTQYKLFKKSSFNAYYSTKWWVVCFFLLSLVYGHCKWNMLLITVIVDLVKRSYYRFQCAMVYLLVRLYMNVSLGSSVQHCDCIAIKYKNL